uniref:Granzyme M n=1 Tax=Sphenodon punctatus TaxID=8508 RepID=A0A8D0GQM7_SPHPU
MENDIMLLRLDKKVPRKIKTISLSKKAPKPGTRCSVAGWGVHEQDGELSHVLRELDVAVMDIRMCNGSRFWNGEVFKNMICIDVAQANSAPCSGDSGGPLVCGKRPSVYGVMSFSSQECVDKFKPPVTTSVFQYIKWIKETMRHLDFTQ